MKYIIYCLSHELSAFVFIQVNDYDIPLTVKDGHRKVREAFEANRHLTDMRAIDLLVVRGQMELVETGLIKLLFKT